jgi:hypothetical protein
MIFHCRQLISLALRFSLLFPLLLFFLLRISLSICAAQGSPAVPQSDEEQLFARAVQDYKSNSFMNAEKEFKQIQGSHAQEAKEYLAKIRDYAEAIYAAKRTMERPSDELDPSSLDFAIKEFKAAIKIKPDGFWNPQERLANAEEVKKAVEAKKAEEIKKAEEMKKTGEMKKVQNDKGPVPAPKEEANKAPDNPKPPTAPAPTPSSNILAEARAAYEGNNFRLARSLFEEVPEDQRTPAKSYLDKISGFQSYMSQARQLANSGQYEDAHAAFLNAAAVKANGPGNPQAGALRMELAEGLDQFYSGDYAAAIEHLETYVQNSGEKQALAHFYLGASKLGRLFLAGSNDANLKQEALQDFKDAKQAGYKAESEDLPPKIMQVYRDLAF